jgi:hypothetical protein
MAPEWTVGSSKDQERRSAATQAEKDQRAAEAAAAFKADREAEGRALDAKTRRLKALRLAHETPQPKRATPAKGKRLQPKPV